MSTKDQFDIITQIIFIILGFMVFWQIKIAKNDLRTKCKREACAISVELAKRFAEEIIPAISKFYTKVRDAKYELKPLSLKTFQKEEIDRLGHPAKKLYDEGVAFFESNPKLRSECIKILNSFEALSMNFIKRVADEDAAFTALHQVYCHFTERAFPVLCVLRDDKNSRFYENTLSLHKIWSNKMKIRGLELQRKSIEEQMNGKAKEIDSINYSIDKEKITPIGV